MRCHLSSPPRALYPHKDELWPEIPVRNAGNVLCTVMWGEFAGGWGWIWRCFTRAASSGIHRWWPRSGNLGINGIYADYEERLRGAAQGRSLRAQIPALLWGQAQLNYRAGKRTAVISDRQQPLSWSGVTWNWAVNAGGCGKWLFSEKQKRFSPHLNSPDLPSAVIAYL